MKFKMCSGCDRGLCACGVGRQDRQLNMYDWLADVPGNAHSTDLVEVQFKNTRKGYYHNVNNLDLKKGDTVTLVGFGTFSVRKRGARTGRNPRTGDTIKIKASKNPAFKAGKALKDAVN